MIKSEYFSIIEEGLLSVCLSHHFFHSKELKGGDKKMDNQSELPADGPVFKEKIGAFQTAIFLHEREGRKVPGIVLEKSFKSNSGPWKHQKMSILSANEIDKLICLLQDTKEVLYKGDF